MRLLKEVMRQLKVVMQILEVSHVNFDIESRNL